MMTKICIKPGIIASAVLIVMLVSACGGGSSSNNNNSSSSSSTSSSSSSTTSSTSSSTTSSSSSSGGTAVFTRPDNAVCFAGDAPTNTTSVDTEAAYPGVSFSNPTSLLQAPGDNTRWYVTEQAGRIMMFENTSNVSSTSEVIDLRNVVDTSSNVGESGLLAMAFHPNFNIDNNEAGFGDVFLFYQASKDTTPPVSDDCCLSRLSRFTSNDGGQTLDPNSETILIEYPNPYSLENHFGGQLGFDEDGFLYLTIGDGGQSGDPDNRAQNTANIWGSMLRIDVNNGAPYSIPASNPFAEDDDLLCNNLTNMDAKAEGENCPEIFAWGLRNTWRWSFDRATGDIWAGDVGQGSWEEVNIIQLGGNYGWRIREGQHCYNPSSACQTAGLIEPVAEVQQPVFQSITGGYVYRGTNIPGLVGRYVFGDYVTGRIYSLISDDSGGWEIDILDDSTGFNIASFAEDQNAELYILNYGAGNIYRFIDNSGGGSSGVPNLLSQTGCVDPANPSQPSSAMIPYDINALFWSDGASKQRWFALPNGQQVNVIANQDWEFPVGSVLMKSFTLNDEIIETRLLKHHNDGTWAGYTYAWNGAGTDADLVTGGRVTPIEGQDWIYPSGGQCLECHTAAAGRALGLETAQLNRDYTYPVSAQTSNQITALANAGILSGTPTDVALVNPADETANLDQRARAWLHTNCAQCHQPGGTANVSMDLRYATEFADMNICNVEPQNGDLGINGAQRLSPGDAELSMIVERIGRRGDSFQMPPIGSNLVDTAGVTLITNWINAMSANICGSN